MSADDKLIYHLKRKIVPSSVTKLVRFSFTFTKSDVVDHTRENDPVGEKKNSQFRVRSPTWMLYSFEVLHKYRQDTRVIQCQLIVLY